MFAFALKSFVHWQIYVNIYLYFQDFHSFFLIKSSFHRNYNFILIKYFQNNFEYFTNKFYLENYYFKKHNIQRSEQNSRGVWYGAHCLPYR